MKLSKSFTSEPHQGPGRLIFWTLLSLAMIALSVQQNVYYADRHNLTGTVLFLVLVVYWTAYLYYTLDRWYVPKKFPSQPRK